MEKELNINTDNRDKDWDYYRQNIDRMRKEHPLEDEDDDLIEEDDEE